VSRQITAREATSKLCLAAQATQNYLRNERRRSFDECCMRGVLKTAPICSSDRPFSVRYFKGAGSLTRDRDTLPSGWGKPPFRGNCYNSHKQTLHGIGFDMEYANGVRKITW